jgi:hypothetical protein
MIVLGLLPFAIWLIGSGIVMVTPPVYHGGAMVRIDTEANPSPHATSERLKSDEVVERAARSLAGDAAPDPMSEYLLWSSLSVTGNAGPNLVKLEARSAQPHEARRMVMAVVDAYEKTLRESSPDAAQPKALVYVTPVEAGAMRVSDETRMMLGIAGFASICLLLCIPFLRFVEGAMPLRFRMPGGFPGVPRTA